MDKGQVFWWIEYAARGYVGETSCGVNLIYGSTGFFLVEADSLVEAINIAQDSLGEAPFQIVRAKLADDVNGVILKE